MNTLYRIFKTQLILIVLLRASFGFAQTVTVPIECSVVVAGNGGAIGFGGKVGDGGMVAMPDQLTTSPFDPNYYGTFTFNTPTGVTTANWLLKGDLTNAPVAGAVSGVIGNYGNVVQPGSGLANKIFSYNKLYRENSTETTNPSYGRSKGQVKLNWVAGTCGASMSFDIFKVFKTALPAIVGPACLKPNTQYTYSVDRIVSDNTSDNIGFDSYYWSGLPNNLQFSNGYYTSADNSSITFTTGATVTPLTLTCCYGRVNPNTADGGLSTVQFAPYSLGLHSSCVATPQILIAPVAPTYATGFAPPACVATGTAASPALFSIVYPNVPVGQVYTWSAPNTGWTGLTTPVVNTTTGSTTLTINTAGNNNGGELTLTITGNGCDAAVFKYQIERSITAPLTIVATGTTTTCLAATSSNNNFTISPTTSNSVVWYLTAVGTAAPLTPISIAGVTLVNATTATVTLNTSGAAVGSFLLNVKSTLCGSIYISTTVNIQPATPVFAATTPTCVVRSATNQVTTINVTPVGGTGTYDWTPLPAGVSFASATAPSNTSSNPTIIMNGTGATSILTVKAIGVNGCNSNSITKTINYISVSTSAPGGGFNDQYLVSGVCGAVTSWIVNGTTYITSTSTVGISSGGGTNNVLTISGTGGAPITQVCANLTGGIQVCATSFGLLTQKQASTTPNENGLEIIKNITISPNPNSGNFTIKVTNFNTTATAVLKDFNGTKIETFKLQKGDNKIDKEGLKKGTYFITLIVDGITETRQVVIK